MIGVTGLAYYGLDALGDGGQFADKEHLMPHMARNFMPEWLAVIMICGAIAAMMSTADSQLLSSASAVSEDIYRRLFRPEAPQRQLLAVSRWATLGIGVVAFVMAWQVDAFVYTLVLYAWAGLGSAFGPPLLLSLWWRGTSRDGVLAGFIAGTVVVISWYNLSSLTDHVYEMIPGFFVSLAATLLVSKLRPPRRTGNIEQDGAF
jgi:Na+/proline symporter